MLINLAGPPASGKTTTALKYARKYQMRYMTIDQYRCRFNDEIDAWYNLAKDVANATPHCILDSSGLSWRLHRLILEHPVIERRGILTIFFHGKEEDFHERLTKRQENKEKREVPFAYKSLDEHSLITYCLDKFHTKYPKYIGLRTDNTTTPEQVYEEFEKIVNLKLGQQ